ncbi:MAG: nucleotide sugar dehydrogenase, partial [Candidatus Omnitrophica bacterium]|nr:nucleotide sugar dehydrogenase [Candidatus Omnitrophota bacterium]
MDVYGKLRKRIETKKAVITVVGLGYVGLPMALEFSKKGFKVNGLDADLNRVKKLNKGRSYINDIPEMEISKAIKSGGLKVTTNSNVLQDSDAVIVCVPTPLGKTHKPDLSFIIDSSKTVSQHLRRGQVVVFESTTYPGTTKEVILPILQKSGLKVGEDFYLAFSPERIDPGNSKYNFTNIPKLIGGITEKGTKLSEKLYS